MTTTTIAAGLHSLRRSGVRNISDLQVLIHLAGVKHATAGELADLTRLSGAATSGRLDRLDRLDVITRSNSKDDRRLVISTITDKGRKLITPFLP